MRKILALAAAAALAAACSPDSDKTNPAIATDETKAERETVAPAVGETSFTEDQAREHIAKAGYTDVSALAKNADGSWQGSAMLNGQPATVVVDYQGNIKALGGDATSPASSPAPAQPTP